jgi:hypothetical protein
MGVHDTVKSLVIGCAFVELIAWVAVLQTQHASLQAKHEEKLSEHDNYFKEHEERIKVSVFSSEQADWGRGSRGT